MFGVASGELLTSLLLDLFVVIFLAGSDVLCSVSSMNGEVVDCVGYGLVEVLHASARNYWQYLRLPRQIAAIALQIVLYISVF